MSVQGVGRTSGIDPVTSTEAPSSANVTAAPAAATITRAPAPSGRVDIQRLIAEKAAAAAPTAAVPENAALRAAFDKIAVPSSQATTYRLDKNVEAFASRWKTLEGAKKSIDTTYFFVDDDIFGYA